MEFRVLGPLEVIAAGGCRLPMTAPSQRALLAILLVRVNQAVGVQQLSDDLWEQSPPANPEVALRMAVSRLRRLLAKGGGEAAEESPLLTRPGGYLLQLDPDRLDACRFERLVAQGYQALADGKAHEAGERLRAALALWRGPALADVPAGPLVTAEATRLEVIRLAALAARIDADEACGRHAEALVDLVELAAARPLDEGVCAKLMRALCRAGRHADALAAYRALRRRLVDELGVEPCPELARLHQAVLRHDPNLQLPEVPAVARPRVIPAQLPPVTLTFVGRKRELAALRARLHASGSGGQAAAVSIVAIDGISGIGKSALAIHAAHQLADGFPDGQLYVDLQGATAGLSRLPPLEALGRFLRALGVDGGDIPAGLEEAAGRFRSEVAGRRLLMVLDNAGDTAQVRPLLPGGPGCVVLVTSRRMLTGLDGATHLHLDVLTAEEAMALLGCLTEPRRVAAEPAAAERVARWCGYLPLGLRIAAARLASRPGWPVAALADRLADEQYRLDELELSDIGVRASFSVSYRHLHESRDPLDRAAAAAFALLGVLDGLDVGVPVTARLLDRPEPAHARASGAAGRRPAPGDPGSRPLPAA